MRTYFVTFMLILSLALMAGCNTMSGIGKDIEQAGDAIEHAATKNKTY